MKNIAENIRKKISNEMNVMDNVLSLVSYYDLDEHYDFVRNLSYELWVIIEDIQDGGLWME